MKTNAIIRIVLWSIAIVVLIGFLLFGLSYQSFRWQRTASDGSTTTNFFPASEIDRITIQWAAGEITVRPEPGIQDIQINEVSHGTEEKYQTVIRHNGSRLIIQFCDKMKSMAAISFGKDLRKDLTILVPQNWQFQELQLEAASSDLTLQQLTIQEVEFDGASGNCEFIDCSIDSLDIDTASGDIRYSGSLNTLEFDAASASFCGILTNTPQRIDMDSMSGGLDITLPEDCGFTVKMEGMSNKFSSDYSTTARNGEYVYGGGGCQIQVSAMSGNVRIRMPQASSANTTK